MPLVGIDASNDRNFEGAKLLPKGIYVFEVTGEKGAPLAVSTAKSSSNSIINIELHCVDESNNGEHKGATVYDIIALTPKSEFKLTHLALATGKYTKDALKASKDATGRAAIDTSLLDHSQVRASIDIEAGKPYTSSDGSIKQGRERNRVVQYLFDGSEADPAAPAVTA